jgi:hypothetical protein
MSAAAERLSQQIEVKGRVIQACVGFASMRTAAPSLAIDQRSKRRHGWL